jgi:hypothetical protein
MVGVKKLNEMRVNLRRSVVNNFNAAQIKGLAALRDKGTESVTRTYCLYGSRHKEGRSFTYGSIMEQEKLSGRIVAD